MESSRRIFISYGHNNYDHIAARLANDLRKENFEVFLDTDYLNLGDWEEVIDNHIKSCKWMLFLVSKRSVQANGYCLNELCRAGELNMTIIPVTLDESLTPLSINRLQRIPMHECIQAQQVIESRYLENYKKILDIVTGNASLGFANVDIRLKTCLQPINNNYDLFNHYLNFCGRSRLFELFEDWVENGSSPIFWLKGNPGVGKTAFSSALCWKFPETVCAIHFCKFNNSDRSDPKKIITTLIYQLARLIPEYMEYLSNLADLEKIFDKNPSRIFEYLLIEPLANIHQSKTRVMVIDALDECTWGGENEIGNILMRNYRSLPNWLKIFITARNETEISRTLSQFYVVDPLINNDEDLREFFIKQLPEGTGRDTIEHLVKKSEGSFLYATEVCKEIKNGKRSVEGIENFPNGICGFFTDCFDRLFAGENNQKNIPYEEIKPLLELLTISQEPVTIDTAMDYLQCDEYQVRRLVSKIITFFPLDTDSNMIHTMHKSVTDWLLNSTASNRYYISKREANQKLANYMLRIYESDPDKNDPFVAKRLGATLMELNQLDTLMRILQDPLFQLNRLKLLHLDTGFSSYLAELSYIYQHKQEKIQEIYAGEAFRQVFSKYRRILYNLGLFFNLRKLGFTSFLNSCTQPMGMEFEIGRVFYYYIVELFDKAIKCGKQLLQSNPQIQADPASMAEVYNVLGLSYRKVVKFQEAIDVFQRAIECGEEVDYLYEISMAHLILSKIKCRMLKPMEARKESRKAISKLEELIDELPEGDEKIANQLFLAEEKRVYADSLIWNRKFDDAREMLDDCARIYAALKRTDRYYIRYKYTSVFLQIMTAPDLRLDAELIHIRSQITQGKYDLGQIDFLRSLNLYLCQKDSDKLEEAAELAMKAIEYYEDICASLELAEASLVYNLCCEAMGSGELYEPDDSNEYIDTWIDYVKAYLEEVRQNG